MVNYAVTRCGLQPGHYLKTNHHQSYLVSGKASSTRPIVTSRKARDMGTNSAKVNGIQWTEEDEDFLFPPVSSAPEIRKMTI